MNNAKIHLIGNLVRDPSMVQKDADNICKFTIAVDASSKRPDGTHDVNFYDCSIWNGRGQYCFNHAQKGTQISLCGDLNVAETTSAVDGTKRTRLRVRVVDFMLLNKLRDTGDNDTTDAADEAASVGAIPAAEEDDTI